MGGTTEGFVSRGFDSPVCLSQAAWELPFGPEVDGVSSLDHSDYIASPYKVTLTFNLPSSALHFFQLLLCNLGAKSASLPHFLDSRKGRDFCFMTSQRSCQVK